MTTIRERIETGGPDNTKWNLLTEWTAGNLVPTDEVDARIAEAVAGERKRLQIKCADISRLYKGEAQGSYETGYMDGASACAAAIAAEEKHQEELFWLREDDRADLKEQQMRDEGDDHDG